MRVIIISLQMADVPNIMLVSLLTLRSNWFSSFCAEIWPKSITRFYPHSSDVHNWSCQSQPVAL